MPTPAAIQGTVYPWQVEAATVVELETIARTYYVNRNPLVARINWVPTRGTRFRQIGYPARPREVRIAASFLAADAVITVSDASPFMNGDVFETPTGEHIELTAAPNTTANTFAVARGVAGTTPAAVTIPGGNAYLLLQLVGNSRTGGETWQKGIAPLPDATENYVQTFQHPVTVSGVHQDSADWYWESGQPPPTPLDAYRQRGLDNMMDDLEGTFWYGRGETFGESDTQRQKCHGLLNMLRMAGRVNSAPVNANAYGLTDFIRDVIAPLEAKGGATTIFHSTDMLAIFAKWRLTTGGANYLDQRTAVFDIRVRGFQTNVLPGIAFVLAPKLRPGTAVAVREQNLMGRFLRVPTWYPRGKAGDVWEGDLIARGAPQYNHPDEGIAIENVTGGA